MTEFGNTIHVCKHNNTKSCVGHIVTSISYMWMYVMVHAVDTVNPWESNPSTD